MSELDLYKEVISELGFQYSSNIVGKLKDNLSSIYSTNGIQESGFNKESSDDDYWTEQRGRHTYELWTNPRNDKFINGIFVREHISEFENFIIIGYNIDEGIVYFECALSDSFIKTQSNKRVNGVETYHDFTQETFYEKFKYMFRDVKIDVLTQK